jgi:23S rRNA pseudouridine1911/1915/1917 synthase
MRAPNGGFRYQEQIGSSASGRNVLTHLTIRHPLASESEWLRRIDSGQVFLENEPARPDDMLQAGQQLIWARPPWIEPEVPVATAILYEDEDLLAVAKPSGLPTLPGGGEFLNHTLLAVVRQRHPEASPMHRLGRGTSGIVLFAPTARARKPLQAAFQGPRTLKVYRTLCSGHPAAAAFAVTAPIGEVPYTPLGLLHAAKAGGRPSESRVTVLERREQASLVDVEILTGRPHQIRIHLAWAGHPLVGDPLYGPGGVPLPGTCAVPGDPGYLLHAHRLELAHPRTGEWLYLHCQPPPLLRTLEKSERNFESGG